MRIRELSGGDIDDAVHLSNAAGWNQTADDWRTLLEVSPDGCFGIEAGGSIVATTTVVCYGDMLAWIGMVLTHPDYRRRGYAKALMEQAIELARAWKVRTIKLDATDQGRPLYQQLGFRDEQPVERWSRGDLPAAGQDGTVPPFREDGGYLRHRPGARAYYLGPCMAESEEAAERLYRRAIFEIGATRYFWDLLPANQSAVALATRLGFVPVRRLTRMVLGETLARDESRIYAIAGFEWG